MYVVCHWRPAWPFPSVKGWSSSDSLDVDPRLARRLIVLSRQLVEAVVDEAGGVGGYSAGHLRHTRQ